MAIFRFRSDEFRTKLIIVTVSGKDSDAITVVYRHYLCRIPSLLFSRIIYLELYVYSYQ